MPDPLPLIAYQIHDAPSRMTLTPAPIEREWMDAANQRFPYRCLPLNIANQNGWVVACPAAFRAYWYGGPAPADVEVRFDGPPDPCVLSHFGVGTITFSLPYLFRTPPGVNLWAKGPSNWPKDGIQALEGVIETDWASSTFTMNWKLTRPNEWVRFEEGEPICMLVPVPRGFAEGFAPRIELLATNPELHEKYKAWEASRSGFLQGLKTNDPEAVKQGWQKDYFQGKTAEGGTFTGHQTRLHIREFEHGG
ncbi:MAG: DUF6065 family protein [Fimbriiglobus sp.]|jgi:hypothetical protein|nr:DUF6065 family protein [Fimbriiglobus sp.]